MSYGYTTWLVTQNKRADARSLGVKLGRVCIKRGLSVIEVATRLGVSRQTIYNWFAGVSKPTRSKIAAVTAYLASLT
jgi:transcriptional regulator with XRE-family HTH domain